MKKLLLAILAVFVSWQILDYLIHGVILMDAYEATKDMWRPMEEISMPLSLIVSLISAAGFCYIYYSLIDTKTMNNALKFGLFFGIVWGVSFGYGSYTFMPIPYYMAFTWFLGSIVETVAAGAILGLMIKPEQPAAEPAES